MRRWVVFACLFLIAAATAATAMATVRARVSYKGTLTDYYNNGPRFRAVRGASQVASFAVSRDGKHILNFVGNYTYYCGAGRSVLRATSLAIVDGRFRGVGRKVQKGVGTNYFALDGHFGPHGTASLTYIDNFVPRGRRIADPYAFAYHHPSQACQSKVSGTLHAR